MKFFASEFSGSHARWFRLSVAPILLISLVGLAIIGAGCSDDSNEISYPTAPAADEMNWLFDVYGTDANNIYACGNKGAMFHFDGDTTWSYVEMGVSTPITKVWGQEDGPLYAVGHAGKVWQLIGGSWSSQTSGTSQDLFGLGVFDGALHISGAEGALRRLDGNSWTGVGQTMVTRNPGGVHAVEDTFMLNEDVASLVTMNEYFIGGAFKILNFEGEETGLNGISGMVMTLDSQPELYDWELRPLGDDQFALSEWVVSTTNSPAVLKDNYLGTSEGWLFQLTLGQEDKKVWSKMAPDLTYDSMSGIRDMWLDEESNLYLVTDDGDLVLQTHDYNFTEDTGRRTSFPISHNGLTSIWGVDTDHIYMTGFTENMIFEASMDFSDTNATGINITEIPLEFPNKGGQSIGMFEDQFGMPRF